MSNQDIFRLILSYDVEQNRLQEYYRFVMGRYLPSMQKMGFNMIEAWTTQYGDFPNRQIGFVTEGRDNIESLLDSETWSALNEELTDFVSDFDYKFVPYREGFQF